MNTVGAFKKVSLDMFKLDVSNLFPNLYSPEQIEEYYSNIQLPTRGTIGSAGYDFHSPIPFELGPGESITIPTGIRAQINDGWFLGCFPRSGLGSRYRLQLDNTVGIIDPSYFHATNEGHIMAKLTNDSKTVHDYDTLHILAGDRFMQGIFMPFGLADGDEVLAVRRGGFGSTGR